MEEFWKSLTIMASVIGVLGGIKFLTLGFERWDKFQERRKAKKAEKQKQFEIHSSSTVELKKLDYAELKEFIDILRSERAEYKAGEEKWRQIAKESFETIREVNFENSRILDEQRRQSKEIEELKEREAKCLENVARLEKEIEDLKERIGKVE